MAACSVSAAEAAAEAEEGGTVQKHTRHGKDERCCQTIRMRSSSQTALAPLWCSGLAALLCSARSALC
jgi:hypothetical protein